MQRHKSRKKTFFLKKKNNFSVVFGVWATKLRFQETIRHVRINCSLRVRRILSSYTFEYVIKGINIFRSWAKKFLPPMETHWDACQNCVSRDQKNVIGKFCFKVKKTHFLYLTSHLERKIMKLLVVFYWQSCEKCNLFVHLRKVVQKIIKLIIVFRLWAFIFSAFGDWFLGKGCQKSNLCLQKIFFERW